MKNLILIVFLFYFSCENDSPSGLNSFKHFNVILEETGESTLFIFQNSITSLNDKDEIGEFDENGILDSDGNIGELLVGAGTWNGSQMEITSINSLDLTQFGGPLLPGAVSGHEIYLKIWDTDGGEDSEGKEYDHVEYNNESGTGTFNELFTGISEIIFVSD